eukprot:Awhi_evm1s4351
MSSPAAFRDVILGEKERRKSSVDKTFWGDHLNTSSISAVLRTLAKYGDTKVAFADIVLKINKRNKMQQRILIATESAIYNIEPHSYKMKRRIPYELLGMISMSPLPDNFFLFHVPDEYDYLMVSGKKVEIVTRIADEWEKKMGKTLKIQFAACFSYRIDPDTTREIQFTRVD